MMGIVEKRGDCLIYCILEVIAIVFAALNY